MQIFTTHFPLRQAAVEPRGTGLSESHRVPSTNWDPRLTMKFSPSDWHIYLHCSSPGCDGDSSRGKIIPDINPISPPINWGGCPIHRQKSKCVTLYCPTCDEAYRRYPGIEGGSIWRKVEGLMVCLGTLLCHEVQLGVLTWLLRQQQW